MPNKVKHCAAVLSLAALGTTPTWADDANLLRTTYALDEARGYCLDVPGFGENARVDEPLQVHTCKYGAALEDQLFARTGGNTIALPEYNRCLAAASLQAGAALHASDCSGGPTQQWRFEWGRLSPESRPDLCVSLAGGAGEIAGTPALITPVYRRRSVSLAACDEAAAALQTLRLSPPDERSSSTANVARLGMPADVAEQLAAFGLEFDGPIARQTESIVSAVPTIYEPGEIEVAADIAYGRHERQRLDIHRGTVRNTSEPMPSIAIFHGGGLVAGSKASTVQAANYFASIGFIGVNANYRLAPDHAWPEGARDVGAVVAWLKDHIADYGGDPEQVFVMGISSGSLHAATYVFMPETLRRGTPRAAGAILMSGPYTFDFQNPSSGSLAYFGSDASLWPERVVPGNVSAIDIPVLFTTAERDSPRYKHSFALLLHELVVEHGVMPRYSQSLGHNHSSQLQMLGTSDTGVAIQLVDFIQQVVNGEYVGR